ncbi:hypothetical protein [Aurantiacibacter poecillastricola]|uniref:hypothetical protein n=1 Tax=Aurantiacibacter poecillastricola TaxID=3064385 RepID=UPI00273F7054|nr:hypothetical protein [Aurantiacibacter sp. 219JJ12-13]MDP5262962.1 hypothetical protein [Aurantiacibacter sp. 219JJ12-13]
MIRTLFAIASLATASPSFAQDAMPEDLAERIAGARAAEETARQLSSVQQASAIAQAQYAGMTQGALGDGYRGAVAFPAEALGVWQVVLVAARGEGIEAPLVALAEYEISGTEILSETLHDSADTPPLSGTALQMARAKYVAPRAVIAAPDAGYCLDGEAAPEGSTHSVSYIPLVLPPDESGAMEAYVLNGPIAEGSLPLGKHYRVRFDEFGQVGDPEIVTDTCEVVTWDADDPDLAMSVYITEYDGGDHPNALHAFLSAQLPMSMGVVTGDIVWPMAGGMIAPPVPAAEAGY